MESLFLFIISLEKFLSWLGQCDTSTQQGTILCTDMNKALVNERLGECTGSNFAELVS